MLTRVATRIKRFGGTKRHPNRVTALVAVLAGIALLPCCASPPPPQQVMVARFNANRANFARMRTLLNEAPQIYTVYHSADDPVIGNLGHGRAGPINVRNTRLSELRNLMREAGVYSLQQDDDRGLMFQTWCYCGLDHMGPGQPSEGFAYRAHRPDRVVSSSIENAPHRDDETVFASLNDGWYLYYWFRS